MQKKITANLQLIIAIGAVAGLVVGVINFFILTAVSPLERRVTAQEEWKEEVDQIVVRFLQLEERNIGMAEDIAEIKNDIKLLVEVHNGFSREGSR